MADIRLSTLQRRTSVSGVTILGYISGGSPVGLDPTAVYPTPFQIGAATSGELSQALSLKQNAADKGLANGYASLGSDGKVPVTQLPTGVASTITLSNSTPSILGAANPGIATTASRSDHIHQIPTTADIGAAPISHTHTIAAVSGLQLALDAKLNLSLRGAVNGVASLGSDGLVPAAQLPPGISQASLDAKADASATTSALSLKADLSYVNTQLTLKLNANDTRVANAIQPDFLNVPVTFTGAYTATQLDNNKTKRCIATTDVVVTLPALSVGTTIKFTQGAAGRMSFAAGAGQTLESVGNVIITNGKGSNVIAHCQASNLWNISGNLV